ncbi:MAG: M6 family metalloprotease domain-containing protein [candidate division WOR-3 bacterium]|nr:M6 family metalloprotease domain-containing protein [candidate division WOR-3 bacterium]
MFYLLFFFFFLNFLFSMPPLFLYEKRIEPKAKIKFPYQIEKPAIIKRTTGIKKIIVLLVDFPDNLHYYQKEYFFNLLFKENSNSLRDYYYEVSYGNLIITGEVFGWFSLNNNYSYYVDSNYGIYGNYPNNSQGLVIDLIKICDTHINFQEYDEDNDGYVDNLIIVHSGPGAEETQDKNDMWSHKWELNDRSAGSPGPYLTDDGVYINLYTIQPERFKDGRLITIGVFAHEFGHLLGLPDLYDTDYSTNGLGIFCLMASGGWARKNENEPYGSSPSHPSIWCKYLLGWLEPDSIQKNYLEEVKELPILPSTIFPYGVRILENQNSVKDWFFNKEGKGEYFLLENRKNYGFDQSLPGEGLLIYHINEEKSNNDNEKEPLVGILQGDREKDYLLKDLGSSNDFWRNDTLGVNDLTTPSTNFYDRTPSGVKISNIKYLNNLMYCDIEIKPLFLGKVYAYPNPFIFQENQYPYLIITYEPSDTIKLKDRYPPFKVKIFTLDGCLVRELKEIPREIKPERRSGFWDMKNKKGEEVASGIYLYLIELIDEEIIERKKGFITIIK